MRIRRIIAALGAFFVLSVGIAACGSSIPDDSVAVMAGNPITTAAFNHWMFVAAKGNASQSAAAPVIVPNDPPEFSSCIAQVRKQIPALAKTPDKTIKADCAELFSSLSSQVMNFLITAYWYQAQAHKDGITVTQAQVLKALATAKKEQFPTTAAFTAFLASTGQTLQDIYFRLRVSQIYTKLIAHYTKKVTPAAIQSYYNAHPTQFGTPETRSIRIVRADSQAAVLAAKAALKSGQSWDAVAKKYSIDAATKNNGGLLVGVTNGEEEQALNAAAFSAPVNKVVGPIHGTFGWYIVEVTKITPATHKTLAASTTLIKELLTNSYTSAAEAALTKAMKTNWGSQTLCRAEYAMADCHGYVAPKTTTTATPTTTAPATTATTPATTVTTTTPTTTTPTTPASSSSSSSSSSAPSSSSSSSG